MDRWGDDNHVFNLLLPIIAGSQIARCSHVDQLYLVWCMSTCPEKNYAIQIQFRINPIILFVIICGYLEKTENIFDFEAYTRQLRARGYR